MPRIYLNRVSLFLERNPHDGGGFTVYIAKVNAIAKSSFGLIGMSPSNAKYIA